MLKFEDKTHTYSVGKQVIPSVTQVLESAGLINISPFAYTDTGTEIHQTCYNINIGVEIKNLSKHAVPRFDAYYNFLGDTGFEVIKSEQLVYNKEFGYAGTYDMYGTMYDKKVLIDIKTGSKHEHWHKLQIVAYRKAMQSMGLKVNKCYALYLPLSGKYKLIEIPPMEILSLWNEFVSALKSKGV